MDCWARSPRRTETGPGPSASLGPSVRRCPRASARQPAPSWPERRTAPGGGDRDGAGPCVPSSTPPDASTLCVLVTVGVCLPFSEASSAADGPASVRTENVEEGRGAAAPYPGAKALRVCPRATTLGPGRKEPPVPACRCYQSRCRSYLCPSPLQVLQLPCWLRCEEGGAQSRLWSPGYWPHLAALCPPGIAMPPPPSLLTPCGHSFFGGSSGSP